MFFMGSHGHPSKTGFTPNILYDCTLDVNVKAFFLIISLLWAHFNLVG